MDNREPEVLKREVEAHRAKIAELAEELRKIEALIGRIADDAPRLMRHAVLLRVALKGRRAAEEIGTARLAAFMRAERADAQ
jgi:hypothetical protein